MKLNRKGISLIVLVITIVVMIILATAIILSLNSSNISGKANEAKIASDIANRREAASVYLSEYEIKVAKNKIDSSQMSANDYVRAECKKAGLEVDDMVVTKEGEILFGSGASAINAGVKIGDYVEYTPTVATSKKYKTYDSDSYEETDTFFATQTGENALKWRYMGIDEEGNALLIADRPTSDLLYLERAEGWLNLPSKVTELCKELYSSEKGTARSITAEDLNMVLEANPVGQYHSDLENKDVDNTERLTIGEIVSQKGEPALRNTSTPDGKTDINTYIADYYSYAGTKYKASTTDEYKLIFQNASENNINYWLASQCVYPDFGTDIVFFDIRVVINGRVGSSWAFDTSAGDNGGELLRYSTNSFSKFRY